ncbi:MAG: DUF3833 family protein [Pseudomonadota bacterium]
MTIYLLSATIGAIIVLAVVFAVNRTLSFIAQRPTDYQGKGPDFDIREVLKGDMICEGVIYGPTGRVSSRFVADMQANWNGDEGYMTEKFRYDTGTSLDREWNLKVVDGNKIIATAPDIIGEGEGAQVGSSVQLKYAIKLPENSGGHVLNTTDWMYLTENGTIMNRSQMRKFGIKVAELVATIRKAA